MDTLDVQRHDGIVTVTLSRPHRKNAVNGTMWDELLATFREIGANTLDRVVVITGAGGDFCRRCSANATSLMCRMTASWHCIACHSP